MYWNRLRAYLKAQYGTTVYKLALSSGCSCPNRDGTLGTRDCIFCDGAGAFAQHGPIPDQLAAAKAGSPSKPVQRPVHCLFPILHQYLRSPFPAAGALYRRHGTGGCGDFGP